MDIREVAAWISVISTVSKIIYTGWKKVRIPVRRGLASALCTIANYLHTVSSNLTGTELDSDAENDKADDSNRKGVTGGNNIGFAFTFGEAPVLLRLAEQFLFCRR